MTDRATKFNRKSADERKETLIRATLSLIAKEGVQGATVRAIATRAEVSQGLIRHYFASKEELITAAYDYHMSAMTNLTAAACNETNTSCKSRLAAFVIAAVSPPVADPQSVSLWAGFLNKISSNEQMKTIHEHTYRDFRNRLKMLIADALEEDGRVSTPEKLRGLSIACNAVIDGLWMEGGALPNAFEPGELPRIALQSVGAIIGLDLEIEDGQP